MEEYTPESQESKSEDLKRWFQDNLRIVISIAIVIVIAGGIYSYSKRGEVATVSDKATEQASQDATVTESSEKSDTSTDSKVKPAISTAEVSKETEGSFIETAGRGNSLTILARTATANYLEKNPDSALTKEHKIFIEDYLRKNVGHKGGVRVGSSVEFSKELIQKAVDQSKNLNEKQLKNLQKYSVRVKTL